MTEKVFRKITGKNAKYTTDKEYSFAPEVVAVLDECSAWYEMGHAAVIEKDNLHFHLVLAYNASYWKTDGQLIAMHLVVHDVKAGTAWIESVKAEYSEKPIKAAIRKYKAIINIFKQSDADLAIEESKKERPWQVAVTTPAGAQIYNLIQDK